MADDGIKVSISPSNVTGGGGRRLTESPSSSFASGGGTQQRYTQPGSQRSEINVDKKLAVDKKLVEEQAALVAEIRELRKTMRATAPQSAERTSLQGRIDELLQQQKRTLTGAAETGAVAREAKALTTGKGAAIMPSARVLAQALVSASRETLQGNPLGAFRHAVSGFNAGRSLIGAGGGAVAEGAAAEGAEAAGAAGVGTMLAAIGVAGAGALAYKAWENPDAAKAVLGAPLAIMEAKKYGGFEEPRQAQAFRAAREFGESGQSMIAATTGGRWSNLGISPSDATQTVSAMRELGGGKYVSNRQAYEGAKLGAYMGLSPEQSAQVGGQAARLGVSPEEAVRIIAQGVTQGNQQGRQFEVAQASLDYLKQLATSAAVSGATGLTSISNLAALLAKSGIPGFQGVAGIGAISGIEAAHTQDDVFGVRAAGQGFVTLGETSILRQVNADKRFASRTPRDRLALSEQIRQAGFSGPYASIYGRAIHSEIATAESSLGLDYGLTAFEEANNFPVGGYRDASGKWVSVNDSVTAMDAAFQSGDFLKASKIQSDLLANGAKNISPMERTAAGLSMGGALTGEATSRTYAADARLETAGLALLRRHLDDKAGASALDYLSSTLGPSKPTKAEAPGVAYTPTPPLPPGGLPTPLATPFATPDALPTPSAASYAASAAGAPIAGAGLLGGLGDSVQGGVMLIAGLLEKLIAAVEGGSGRALGAPAAPPNPMPPIDRPDKKRISLK